MTSGEPLSLDGTTSILSRQGFAELLDLLRADGWTLVGPTVRDGAIVDREIDGVADLPVGWTADQDAGSYRLRRRDDDAVFGFTVGPSSWKERFFVTRRREWQATRDGDACRIESDAPSAPRLAL